LKLRQMNPINGRVGKVASGHGHAGNPFG
jgi:hypothetical protein